MTETTTSVTVPPGSRGARRWAAVGRLAAYGAALAMLPYFLIKITWTLDGLGGGGPGHGAWSMLDWATVNGLTVAMSGAAILVALVLARPWGMRLPAWLLLLPAWVAMGFLVSVLPVLPVLIVLRRQDWAASSGTGFPAWELPLISASFTGFACCMALAAPVYAQRRWPQAFAGRVGDRVEALPGLRRLQRTVAALGAALCVVLGLTQAYWAAGGTFGLDPNGADGRDAAWHLLTATGALWSLIAGWGVWTMAGGSGRVRLGVAVLLTWVAAGSLFAWGSWRAIFSFAWSATPAEAEPPIARALLDHASAVAGLLVVFVLLVMVALRPRPGSGG